MADATTPKPSRRKMSTPRRAAATELAAQPDPLEPAGVGRGQPPGAGHDQGEALERVLETEMSQKVVARHDWQPQPQHALPGERKLRHDVDEAFRGELQLELIPVGRHRPLRLEHDAQPRIGVDDPHGPAPARPGSPPRRQCEIRPALGTERAPKVLQGRKRGAGHGNSACRGRKPIPLDAAGLAWFRARGSAKSGSFERA
jgi:hypothetical protein